MESLFWISIFLILYPYVVYPSIVAMIGWLRPRAVRRADIKPGVSVLVPAYNEAGCIAATLGHLLLQDYPADRLQIIVVSDGSDDGTDAIVQAFAGRGVELLRQEGRGGKALALNAAVRHARGEIIVFCDANARFAADAITQIVRSFADPQVGYVTGQLGLVAFGDTVSGGGSGAYMRYENLVRTAESRMASIIGVNGGVDAMRRSLYSDVASDLITDFVLPLRVIAAGHRVVYDSQARSTEEANAQTSSEFRMRVRVALRALQGLVHMKELLNPLRHPLTSFCLVSHKVLRYLGFVFLVTALVSNLWLAAASPAYRVLLLAHLACYALALAGIVGFGKGRLARIARLPAYLLMTYAAFAVATLKFLRGRTMATWHRAPADAAGRPVTPFATRTGSAMEDAIDEAHPSFIGFMGCFMRGASLQDIYSDAESGYAVRTRQPTLDAATRERRLRSGRTQFMRIFEHDRNIVEPVDRHIGIAGKKVLDFGCGTGALAIALARRGAGVTGVDPTPESLEACHWRASYFACESRFESRLVGTEPGLPYADASFDIVILNSVLEFIPHDRHRYVLDFLRLVKPGGHLVISTQNGLFPVDYYTREVFPLWRRRTMIARNLPYGSTYFELRRWIRVSPRTVEDLSVRNWFNSVDKLTARQQSAGRTGTASVLRAVNGVVKSGCRFVGVPSDILLPYAIYLFRVTA